MLANKRSYVEFGSGGSTFVASSTVSGSVISVDSSQEWLGKVAAQCREAGTRVTPLLRFVDLGPIGAWGVPKDTSLRATWPAYHTDVWSVEGAGNADVYFVDGRFRVACFLKSLLHCRQDSVLMFHDFDSRPRYHIVRDFASEIANDGDLSVFVPRVGIDMHRMMAVLDKYSENPE
jgi:hypothetical protein